MSKPWCCDNKLSDWQNWCLQKNYPRFYAQQIFEWIFAKGSLDPLSFLNLKPQARNDLIEEFSWDLPIVDDILTSKDGSDKILFKSSDNLFYEAVLMPSENRVTLCVSSQIGCRMGCRFCQTGKMGLARQLSSGEILAQLLVANRRLLEKGEGRRVTNVVFMGMGEPLDNYDNVVESCRVMINPRCFGLSKHRVTVSTSGLLPEIARLGEDVPVSLAISLHASDNKERSALMPINIKYPLEQLKEVLMNYPLQTRHGITFEYVLIKGKNDTLQHAKSLVRYLSGLKAKVNLIPMNPHPGSDLSQSDAASIRAFQEALTTRGITAPVRYSRGRDVSAACGQLATKKQEELGMPPRSVVRVRRQEVRAEGLLATAQQGNISPT